MVVDKNADEMLYENSLVVVGGGVVVVGGGVVVVVVEAGSVQNNVDGHKLVVAHSMDTNILAAFSLFLTGLSI